MRSIPLWKSTVIEIRAWLRLNPMLRGEAALLPNRDGQAMCRSNVTQRLALAVTRATAEQPSLSTKRVSPHTLRHTSAMHLLQSGVPFNVIALWLGHESTTTTHRYVEADLAMKEKTDGVCPSLPSSSRPGCTRVEQVHREPRCPHQRANCLAPEDVGVPGSVEPMFEARGTGATLWPERHFYPSLSQTFGSRLRAVFQTETMAFSRGLGGSMKHWILEASNILPGTKKALHRCKALI